jgi:hypothetical protein
MATPAEEGPARDVPQRYPELMRRWLTMDPAEVDTLQRVEELARQFAALNVEGLRLGAPLHQFVFRRGLYLLGEETALPALFQLYTLLDQAVSYIHQEVEPPVPNPYDA